MCDVNCVEENEGVFSHRIERDFKVKSTRIMLATGLSFVSIHGNLYITHLEVVVPALWPVGVGSAHQEDLGGQLGKDSDMVLAFILKKKREMFLLTVISCMDGFYSSI